MASTQEITRRIKSVKSTRKITRAMQMVSAAKMRKAQNATMASRTYAELAWQLISTVGPTGDSPILQTYPEATKVGVVIISSNRGLVGSFNTNLLNEVRKLTAAQPELLADVIVMGRKAREGAQRLKFNLSAEFPKLDTTIPVEEIYPIAKLLTEYYSSGQYRKILVVYNKFVSTLVQQPTAKQLLPFSEESTHTAPPNDLIIYEPSPDTVLNHLLPRIIESQIYQAVLESDASEHSARMVMMKNATEAAGELIDDLTLTYNQLRQNKITTELSEITAGKIALEKN
jgi:F-type H+-transporting ATPase subunit gamma